MSVSRIHVCLVSVLAWSCLCSAAWTTAVAAQEVPVGSTSNQEQTMLDPLLKPAHHRVASPERFFLELGGGPYRVFADTSYDVFRDDPGLAWTAKLDGILYRLPSMLYVTLGASVGYIGFSAKAVSTITGEPASEETSLSLVPVGATAGVRLDALARRLGIPVIFAARVGWQWTHWDTNTGKVNDASGWSLGPVITGQVALDLDSFEKGAARALDEEWGINHTYLFGEITHYATTSKSLPVGGTHWAIGLGLAF